jgi:hypothetical protein
VNEIFNILRNRLYDIAPFAVWVPILTGLPGIKKAPVYIRLLMVHLVLAAIVQAYAYYLWKHSQNNLYLLHLYTVEELALITLFYSYLLQPAIKRVFFNIVIAVFAVCAVLNALYLQPITRHNTYMRSLGSLMIITWTILYFYRRLADEQDNDARYGGGILWINSGFLLYFSTSLLLFSLGNFMAGNAYKEITKSLWAIHAVVSILLYLIIAIGLWKHRKTMI